MKSFGIISVVLLVAVLAVLVLRRRADAAESGTQFYSIVCLRSDHLPLDVVEVRKVLERTFDNKFGEDPKVGDVCVEFKPGFLGITYLGRRYGLMSIDDRYGEANAARLDDADLRIANAFKQHRAWLACDLIDDPDPQTRGEAYSFIARLMAAFIDDKSLMIYCSENGQSMFVHEETAARLSGDDPFVAFEPWQPPMTKVKSDHPLLLAAIDEAKSKWGEFVERFNAKDARHFSIKTAFRRGEEVEHMWVAVEQIDGETVRGTLNNEPAILTHLKEGDSVAIAISDVEDWVYVKDDTLHGGFSIKAIKIIQKEQKQ